MAGFDPITLAIVLLLVGCALVVLEVFIPSGGMLGLLAVCSLVASLIFAFRYDFNSGLVFTLVALLAVPGTVILAFKIWPHTPMGKAFLGELPSEEELKPADARRSLVGEVGVAKSKMLPSGSIEVQGKRYDAVSRGGGIEPGEAVVVVEVQGNRIMVRLADDDEAKRLGTVQDETLNRPLEDPDLDPFDEPLA